MSDAKQYQWYDGNNVEQFTHVSFIMTRIPKSIDINKLPSVWYYAINRYITLFIEEIKFALLQMLIDLVIC